MSEENKNKKDEEEKQTNRTFTQSEADKMIADAVKKATDKFSDYDGVKKKLTELESEKKKADEASMSEIEKVKKQNSELTERIGVLEGENLRYKKTALRADVLSDPRFVNLPGAYRKLIDGDDKDKITESADKVLAEWQEDLKKAGVKVETPPPVIPAGSGKPPTPTENFADKIAKRFQVFGKK